MASPMPDSYSAATGQAIYGGRYNSVPMDVVNNVWTPTTDASGNILSASWANLPLDEWCAISGTALQAITDALVAADLDPNRIDYGTSNVLGTFKAWCGAAVDEAGGRAWIPWGGGHNDSSMNGIWRIDLERADGWAIEVYPSDPDAPGYEWSQEYRDSNSYSLYNLPAPLDDPADILPDNMPTSRHTYEGVWYDSARNRIGQCRNRMWYYDVTTGQTNNMKWWGQTVPLYNASIQSAVFYDEVHDRLTGYLRSGIYDYSTWGWSNLDTGEIINTDSYTTTHTPMIVRKGREIHVINENLLYGVFDMDSLVFTTEQTLTGLDVDKFTQPSMASVYIPEWDRIMLRYSASPYLGQWDMFDLNTLQHETYAPQGIEVPYSSYPSSKVFYYPRRKCVIYITAPDYSSPSVYVMRVG